MTFYNAVVLWLIFNELVALWFLRPEIFRHVSDVRSEGNP